MSELASRLFDKSNRLTKEQAATIGRAAETLSRKEKKRILCCFEKVSQQQLEKHRESITLQGEGPSDPRKFGPEPTNKNTVIFDSTEVDIQMQIAALRSLQDQRCQDPRDHGAND